MKLYNTLTRKVEKFNPLKNGAVTLYTCGPTVYHFAHIGNLRNVIFNDTLRRALEISGYKVTHVMNITDVGHLVSDADEGDDKLEKGAKREGKTVWEVADFYIDAFLKHTNALNVLPPTKIVRATDAIDSQQEIIKILLKKGFVYQTQQAIYFDVTKLDDYGKLSGQKLSEKAVAVRREVVTDKDKKHPQDFALWFFTVGHFSDHQMRWDSPWGEGFPGWHLECSAIIHQELGEPIDIHTGGVDHIGTHHTNEIAQSEAAFEKPLANYWLHNEFLHQDGGKMSKSGETTITLDDVVNRGYDPLALRLFYLQSHYRSHANFTWENLTAAQNRLKDYRAMADMRFQIKPAAGDIFTSFEDFQKLTLEKIQNDLNTPEAMASISQLANDTKEVVFSTNEKEFNKFLQFIDGILGLNLLDSKDISDQQKDIITDREKARKKKDWAKSDKLRDRLKEQGIGLRDSEHGPIWYRI
ncbi:cysteine--tRNA ligase [Candidatus Parcubacteria bacterium]|nr:cysteine--tRNA ligase [Candidatus Parcubacteria bacterium]